MTSTVTIRRADHRDRAVIHAFHRALYIGHRDRILPSDLAPFFAYRDLETALREDADAILGNRESVALLAEEDGKPVGYITGHLENDPRRVLPRKGVVEDWFVHDEARGRGLGRALFDALVDIFRAAGCQVVESATWPFNTGAVSAHQALGFQAIEIKFRKRI